jgi:RND family efflux transporter MFP subunit
MKTQDLKLFLNKYSQYVITTVITLVALIVLWWLWIYYQVDPWTRDGRLRADVVRVAPDVSGLVTEIYVKDNQEVQRGQKLFAIDQQRFALALEDAEAKVTSDKAALAESMREDVRNRNLGNLVPKETREQTLSRTLQLRASLNQAISSRNLARLNLARTIVVAPVNGVVTNFELQPGNYLSTGQQALAIVDSDTLRLEGYFEETKLPHIHIGDKAAIHLMGEKATICGHVESIAAGIEDRERSPTLNQLPNINPTFNWVRLAQRIPVRIVLDDAPKDIRLIAGRTATVKIIGQHQC